MELLLTVVKHEPKGGKEYEYKESQRILHQRTQKYTALISINIVTSFRGMHVSPAKHGSV